MTTPPFRKDVCTWRFGDPRHAESRPSTHFPIALSVESERNADMEYQFSECLHCGELIARFRFLVGGTWYDHWSMFDFGLVEAWAGELS